MTSAGPESDHNFDTDRILRLRHRDRAHGWSARAGPAACVIETRTYEFENGLPEIDSDQIHFGLRHYLGRPGADAPSSPARWCSASAWSSRTRHGTETWLGWAAGGGLNLALSKDFSIETYVMYEGMPDVKSYPGGDSNTCRSRLPVRNQRPGRLPGASAGTSSRAGRSQSVLTRAVRTGPRRYAPRPRPGPFELFEHQVADLVGGVLADVEAADAAPR